MVSNNTSSEPNKDASDGNRGRENQQEEYDLPDRHDVIARWDSPHGPMVSYQVVDVADGDIITRSFTGEGVEAEIIGDETWRLINEFGTHNCMPVDFAKETLPRVTVLPYVNNVAVQRIGWEGKDITVEMWDFEITDTDEWTIRPTSLLDHGEVVPSKVVWELSEAGYKIDTSEDTRSGYRARTGTEILSEVREKTKGVDDNVDRGNLDEI